MNAVRVGLKGFEVVAGIGIDTMITTLANKVIPETYGVVGMAQKVCIKAGSIGLSLVATKALGDTIDEYLDALEEEIEKSIAE